jgi:hypothetical protein
LSLTLPIQIIALFAGAIANLTQKNLTKSKQKGGAIARTPKIQTVQRQKSRGQN